MDVAGVILAFCAGLLLLYLLGMLLVAPLKLLLRLIVSSAIGFAALIVLNVVGGALFHFTLALNALNAVIVGVFGVPGLALLIVLKLFL